MSLHVHAPFPGTVLGIEEVPDPVFAASMVGAGVGLDPGPTAEILDVVAPVAGRLMKVHPHAFIIATSDGHGILVHVGIDTVKLDGAPFTMHRAQGDQVARGDLVVTVDVGAIRAAGMSLVSPVVVMDVPAIDLREVFVGRVVQARDSLFALASLP